jgi:hypothetical protein
VPAHWMSSPERRGPWAMPSARDERAEELEQLRLALATFALQLDAFEMRAKELLLAAGKVNANTHRGPPRRDNEIVRQ